MQKLNLYVILLMTLLATPAHAYIGPGAGAGAIAVVLGVIGAFLLAFVAIIWYPVKRLLRNRKTKTKKTATTQSDNE